MRCRCWLIIGGSYILLQLCSSQALDSKLQCRDNHNNPVDWWYMYKPPAVLLEPGTNFSYIWSGGDDRIDWLDSDKPIDKHSMLQNTLWPTYVSKNRLAAIVYTSSKGFLGTSAMGILLADDTGAGLWLGHTVPDYPETISKRSDIPPEEMVKGHLFACVSLSQQGVNAVANTLDLIAPAVTELKLPGDMAQKLPAFLLQLKLPTPGTKLTYMTKFQSQNAKVFTLTARIAGDGRCLYESFARSRQIVLDVYGNRHDGVYSTTCIDNQYGVRNIKSIAIKKHDDSRVNYVLPELDRARFAVSTAAHWQTRGAANNSYWVCVSNLDKEEKRDSPGGLLMCVEDYFIWRAFTNLKVSEPTCW